MMKLSDYVVERIVQTGVKHVFLLAGGGSMHLVDSVGRRPEIEYVCNLHEQACSIAAEAYGQYTNNLGVAMVTTGPGGTNAITGLAGAWLESTPCMFISGQVKRADLTGDRGVRQMGFQELNIIRIVESLTKYAVTITDPLSIRYHMDRALHLARTGRPGPVWIDIPLDVQSAQIDENNLEGYTVSQDLRDSDSHSLKDRVRSAIELINKAERPLILVGNGVRLARGLDELNMLFNIVRVPILTTWKMADLLPEDHPMYIGRPGSIGQRAANFAQQNCDFILVLGARLDLGQTGYNHPNFARTARKVVVDIDPAEIKKLDMAIDLPICADSKAVLLEFLRQAGGIAPVERDAWWRRCREWKRKYQVVLPEYWDESQGVSTYVLIDVLSDEMSPEDLLVPGSSGTCSEVTMQAFRVKSGMRILNTQGLGSMGFGISASIGACLAAGRKRTVCVDGDGGFLMNIQELETVKRLNLPIKFFVLNNRGYGSIQATQNNYFDGFYVGSNKESGMTLPEIIKVAEAFGLKTAFITSHENIREKVADILKMQGPVVCEVTISPNQTTAPRLSSFRNDDGTISSRPLEDMWPFLDREEFVSNMLNQKAPNSYRENGNK
ncbi:Thiamine pyrophosphate enzyme TPP binding domain protein [Syntrophobacter sp. SbD1]|nr:Thiamine pyrophosphate enzyme TPP binding domain protein [Syntrophobacter sp. SbD1]